jgi:hypothetical protein
MVAARRMVREHFGGDHHPVYRVSAQIFAAVIWPFAVLIQLLTMRYFDGPEAVPINRARGALWAAMRHNVQPGEYYAYALWHRDHKANIDNYLYCNEGSRLFKLLNRPSQPDPIDDKLAFYEMCRAHALPTPAILAAFSPSGKLLEFESGRPPKRDLFVKPRIGAGSVGSEHFRWQGEFFRSDLGNVFTRDTLAGYIAKRALIENRTLLIQPALYNHPELRTNANASLATARLVSGITTDNKVVPIFGFFSYIAWIDEMPELQVAHIDIESARLTWDPRRSRFGLKHHSEYARLLPDWGAVLRLSETAHKACANFVFIGWDAAFTEDGPVLLEGNANWCADDYQRSSGQPLGHTKFAEILEARLRTLELDNPAPGMPDGG